MSGVQVPISEVADIQLTTGPSMIRDENGMLAGYVYVDIAGRDVGGYVEDAKKLVRQNVKLPTGYSLVWSGQYENMLRVTERLKIVLPITILLIFVLLYMNTKSAFKTVIVMLAVPFSVVGAVWLMYLLDYNISIAAWVGMIALMGLDAETGVFMLLFLDLSYDEAKKKGKLRTLPDLKEAIVHGAVKRIRPKIMTVAARHGPHAHHVDYGDWGRYDEAHRRTHGGRAVHFIYHGTAGLSGHLSSLEIEL